MSALLAALDQYETVPCLLQGDCCIVLIMVYKPCICIVSPNSREVLSHLSHSGDLLLWVRVQHHASTSSFQELLGQSLVCSICWVKRQEIVNFMITTPREGNFGVKSVIKCKIDVFL